MRHCCANCLNIKAGYKHSEEHPEGNRFNDEYRCQVYKFLFWYQDNLEGMDSITCTHFRTK